MQRSELYIAAGVVAGIIIVLGGVWVFISKPVDGLQDLRADPYAAAAQQDSGKAGDTQPLAGAPESAGPSASAATKIMQATFYTNKGDITIEFFGADAPKTVANFTSLAAKGFYDNTKFHRVIKGFMIQGGDPLSKNDSMMARWGTGGPGYTFADELRENNRNDVGTISMANAGPDTNGSQFFINVAANNFLDGKHTVFGKVVSGLDIVQQIAELPTDSSDRPTSPVIIQSITLR